MTQPGRRPFFRRAVDFAKWRVIEQIDRRRFAGTYDVREPNHVWEVHTLKRMFQTMPIDCVWDVGANRGEYARMLRRDIGYRGLIISFEPIPGLAAKLRRMAQRDPRWKIEEIAISQQDGSASFNIMANQEFSSLHLPSESGTREFHELNKIVQSVAVRTERLDTAYSRLKAEYGFQNPFLKLDTQGNDVHIVRAALQVAQQFVAIQSELSFVPIYTNAATSDEALGLYRDAGFVLGALIPNNPGHFPRLIECDCLMVRADYAGGEVVKES